MNSIEETRTKFLNNLHCVVEATSYEQIALYIEYHLGLKLSWEQQQIGCLLTIGEINKHPICIEVCFTTIDCKNIIFYNACSRVVDYDIVDDYIAKNFKSKNMPTDAMNFRNAINT